MNYTTSINYRKIEITQINIRKKQQLADHPDFQTPRLPGFQKVKELDI